MYFLDEGELAINMKSNQNSITYPLKPPFFLEAAKLPPADALSVVAFESGRQKEKKMKHSHLKKRSYKYRKLPLRNQFYQRRNCGYTL